MEQLNIGNIHADEGKEKISQFIYLGKEDKQALCLMRDNYGVTFNTKTSPLSNDGSQYLDVLMEKYLIKLEGEGEADGDFISSRYIDRIDHSFCYSGQLLEFTQTVHWLCPFCRCCFG